jgi:hypothetical protein
MRSDILDFNLNGLRRKKRKNVISYQKKIPPTESLGAMDRSGSIEIVE